MQQPYALAGIPEEGGVLLNFDTELLLSRK